MCTLNFSTLLNLSQPLSTSLNLSQLSTLNSQLNFCPKLRHPTPLFCSIFPNQWEF